jgi:hypothetical protein
MSVVMPPTQPVGLDNLVTGGLIVSRSDKSWPSS